MLYGFILEKHPFIKLPDVYYVTHLPARMEIELFFIVFPEILLFLVKPLRAIPSPLLAIMFSEMELLLQL